MGIGEDDDEEFNSNTPPSIKNTAQEASNSALVPTKSAKAYESTYSQFYKWFRGLDGVTETTKISESFLVTYFDVKVSKASAWSIYSRLKCKLREKHDIHIEKFDKLQYFSKRKTENHVPVQANVFTSEQLHQYLRDAPDDGSNFMKKMALIFGLSGGLRVDELTHLKRDDITVVAQGYLKVTIQDSKTGPRKFVVHTHEEKHLNAVEMYQHYLKMLPTGIKSDRVWLRMENGKIQDRPLGKNNMAEISKEIARFLKLPNPEDYTSHSIRRSGSTILAEAGFSTEALRQYGGWKNASTAQIYIENTESNKKRLAESVLDPHTATKKPYQLHSFTPSKEGLSVPPFPQTFAPTTTFLVGATLNNCVIHIHHETEK